MEENNQNFQVEQNNYNTQVEENLNGTNMNNQTITPRVQDKPTVWPVVLFSILCALSAGVSLFYFVQSINLEGWENLIIIWTFPIIIGCNILATLFSIINFAIAFKKSKAQRIFTLILMILVIIYSVFSVVFFYMNK